MKWGKGRQVKEANYSFSDMSMATSLGQGREPPPPQKKSVGGGECRQPASFRTVLAHLDFRPNILHMSRKRTVIQTVLTLQSPSLGVLSMIEYNIHSTDIGPVAP